jgi:hypothetical protein
MVLVARAVEYNHMFPSIYSTVLCYSSCVEHTAEGWYYTSQSLNIDSLIANNQVEEDEMGGPYSTNGGEEERL